MSTSVFFVGGGVEHPETIVRMYTYGQVKGGEGLVSAGDLLVRQAPIAGGSVRVVPGGAYMLSRYAGAIRETYFGAVLEEESLVIPTNTSGQTRYDLIVMRVKDPFVEGSPWPDPAAGITDPEEAAQARASAQIVFIERIGSVPASTTRLQQVATYENDTAVTLARIAVPSGSPSGAITDQMITNLAQVCIRNIKTEMRVKNLTAADAETLTSTAPRGEAFPNGGGAQYIDIPSWATRMQIEADWIGLFAGSGDSRGSCWVEFGPYVSGSNWTYQSEWNSWNAVNTNDNKTMPMASACDIPVPAAIRGTTQRFVMKARIEYATSNAARPFMTSGSSARLKVTFYEDALSVSNS